MRDDCPSSERLHTFGLGLLAEADAWPIEAHLTACAVCTSRLGHALPADELLNTLRMPAVAVPTDDPELRTLSIRLRSFVAGLGPATPVNESEIGGTLGRYILHEVLGRGGMGIVYRAEDPQLKRDVALKVLLDQRFTDSVQLARFQREAEVLARLQHPAIVSIHDVGVEHGRLYLALEYVAGGTLADALQGQPKPLAESVALLVRLAKAVAYAHAQGIVHRDIKPSNILLAESWQHAKIADFGLARRLDETGLTETGAVLGTPGYLAPEQIVGRGNTARPTADVYSLGALLYELLTGRPPYRGENVLDTLEQARTTDPVAPRRLRSSIPRDLETITLKCLRRDPRKRYANAVELQADLERYQRGEPIRAKRAGRVERLVKWTRRNPMATTLLLVLLGASTALAIAQRQTHQALQLAEQNENKAQRTRERANKNYQAARDALQKMLARTTASGRGDIPGVRTLSRQQQEDALAFYLTIAEQTSDDPDIKYDVAVARYQAARLQDDFGQRTEAKHNSQEALRLFEELLTHDGQNFKYRSGHLDALVNVAMGETDADRDRSLLRAVHLAEQLTRDFPEEAYAYGLLGITLHNQGFAAYHKDDKAAAEGFFRAAVQAHEQRRQYAPHDRVVQLALANALLNVHLLEHQQGMSARATGERADELLVQLVRTDPTDYHTLARLGDHRTNAAYSLFNDMKGELALQRLKEVLALLETAHKNEPNYTALTNALYTANGACAEVSMALRNYAVAIQSWRRVVSLAPPEQRMRRHADLIACMLTANQVNEAMAEAKELASHLAREPHGYAISTSIRAAARRDVPLALQWTKQAKEHKSLWMAVRKDLLADAVVQSMRQLPEWQTLLED